MLKRKLEIVNVEALYFTEINFHEIRNFITQRRSYDKDMRLSGIL